MDVSTPEEAAARNAALEESAERDRERLAEQCCDEFHGELLDVEIDRRLFQGAASRSSTEISQ